MTIKFWIFSKHFNDDVIITISNPISTLGEMQKQVEKILEENAFIKKNLPLKRSITYVFNYVYLCQPYHVFFVTINYDVINRYYAAKHI